MTQTTANHPTAVRRERYWRCWSVAIALCLILVAVVGIWHVVHRGTGLGAEAVVTASSTAIGSSPRNVVSSGRPDRPGAGWQSAGPGEDSWIQMQWSDQFDLTSVAVVRSPLSEPGVVRGYFSFSDGSHLQLTLSTTSRITIVPISVRLVNMLRFTVTEVEGNVPAAIDELVVYQSAAAGLPTTATHTDAALDAEASTSVAASSQGGGPSQVGGLNDGTDAGGLGTNWEAVIAPGDWVQLTWKVPQEISSVVVHGRSGASVRSGTLVFSDGSSISTGAVLSDMSLPTVVGFLPRVVTSVRLIFNDVDGPNATMLAELGVYRVGSTPPVEARRGSESGPSSAACSSQLEPQNQQDLVVLCPTNGATVAETAEVRLSALGGFNFVTATFAGQPSYSSRVAVGDDGEVELDLNTASVPAGPFTVHLVAAGRGRSERVVNLQLVKSGPVASDTPSSAAVSGRTLVWSDEFHYPVSTSRTGVGAQYASGKPTSAGTSEDFGEAIFADPSQGLGNMTNLDDQYLVMNVLPRPQDAPDPQGWRRDHIGAMLASARIGGSGVSAQYGYFEIRMAAPAMPGTWPAFWLLPTDNLVVKQSVVAEIDAVEMYGHNPKSTCSTTHSYADGKDKGIAECGKRFETDLKAFGWHTYGVSVLPDANVFYIDGLEVARAPQVPGGGSPMFFMVDLALGGGWPVSLGPVKDRASLYVDYVRVYV